jgi:hypothetical protein
VPLTADPERLRHREFALDLLRKLSQHTPLYGSHPAAATSRKE